MCGIFGAVAARGARVGLDRPALEHLIDTMARRGPDGRGLVLRNNVALGHRRLAVVDVEAGAQPMCSPDGRFGLVYNGELYNDPELRAALEREGVHFRTRCDTETVLWALATWGIGGIKRLRGMYGLAFYDFERHQLLLARDPMGNKPLYAGMFGDDFCFSSHLPALLAHPAARPEPNVSVLKS